MIIAGINALYLLLAAGILSGVYAYSAKKMPSMSRAALYGVAVLLSVGSVFMLVGTADQAPAQAPIQAPTTGSGAAVLSTTGPCGSTLGSTMTVFTKNIANKTGPDSEFVAPSMLLIRNGVIEQSLTGVANSSGLAISVTCGQTYTLVALASSTLNGASKTFVAEPSGPVNLELSSVATLTFRAYDNQNNGDLMYDTASDSRTSQKASGATFTGVVDNATATTIGLNGKFDVTIEVTGSNTAVFGDQSMYIGTKYTLLDFSTPVVKTEGGVDLPAASTLTQNDVLKATSDGYYNLYKAPAPIYGASAVKYRVIMNAKDNTNPSNDVTVGFFSEGVYSSIDGKTYKSGVVKDDSSLSYVHTVASVIFDLA